MFNWLTAFFYRQRSQLKVAAGFEFADIFYCPRKAASWLRLLVAFLLWAGFMKKLIYADELEDVILVSIHYRIVFSCKARLTKFLM